MWKEEAGEKGSVLNNNKKMGKRLQNYNRNDMSKNDAINC
jgi:hypothetical protein